MVKIGSSLLTNNGKGLDHKALARWTHELAALHRAAVEIIVVSSGAVAEGMARLGWRDWPVDISALQAAAAVGQMGLMQAYETCFRCNDMRSAQVLLTHEDFSTCERYLNIQATLRRLVQMDTIPVINENDAVSTEEIRFGDNDMLAALVANMLKLDSLDRQLSRLSVLSVCTTLDPACTMHDVRSNTRAPEPLRRIQGRTGDR